MIKQSILDELSKLRFKKQTVVRHGIKVRLFVRKIKNGQIEVDISEDNCIVSLVNANSPLKVAMGYKVTTATQIRFLITKNNFISQYLQQ